MGPFFVSEVARSASPKGKPGSERSETEAGAANLATPKIMDSRLRGNDGAPEGQNAKRSECFGNLATSGKNVWIPAYAGMTNRPEGKTKKNLRNTSVTEIFVVWGICP